MHRIAPRRPRILGMIRNNPVSILSILPELLRYFVSSYHKLFALIEVRVSDQSIGFRHVPLGYIQQSTWQKDWHPESRFENWGQRPTGELPQGISCFVIIWERTWVNIHNRESSFYAYNIPALYRVLHICIPSSILRDEALAIVVVAQLHETQNFLPSSRDLSIMRGGIRMNSSGNPTRATADFVKEESGWKLVFGGTASCRIMLFITTNCEVSDTTI